MNSPFLFSNFNAFHSAGLWLAAKKEFSVSIAEKPGIVIKDDSYLQKHIDAILKYPWVNAKAIGEQEFKIVVDAVNSTGAIFVPALLKALGINDILVLNGEVNGKFAHNPEPLPENLTELSKEVLKQKAHLGIAAKRRNCESDVADQFHASLG